MWYRQRELFLKFSRGYLEIWYAGAVTVRVNIFTPPSWNLCDCFPN